MKNIARRIKNPRAKGSISGPAAMMKYNVIAAATSKSVIITQMSIFLIIYQ
jgi:hypothetical protein